MGDFQKSYGNKYIVSQSDQFEEENACFWYLVPYGVRNLKFKILISKDFLKFDQAFPLLCVCTLDANFSQVNIFTIYHRERFN